MKDKTKLHEECHHDIINVENVPLQGNFRGQEYVYEGEIKVCSSCNHDILDEEVEEHNLKALQDAYRAQNNIIPLEKIQDLPQKYDIGKRPLSHLLKWGELTFTRYYEGDIPSKAYSTTLEEIYENPKKYLEILELNKDLISEKAYKKSRAATLILLETTSKISDVLKYIMYHLEDITVLSAQKLLYYSQGFYSAFFNDTLFEEDCYTNDQGLIYRDLYKKIQDPCYLSTNIDLNNINLSFNEKIVIDAVIKYLGCYSGKTLKYFTESEIPYLKSKSNKNYTNDQVILKADISNYFQDVIRKYNMISISDIRIYARNMFDSI